MKTLLSMWVLLLCSLPVAAAPAEANANKGTLVIAGGAVRADNADVFGAFIRALPANGPVVIVPAASGQPSRSARDVADSLTAFGVSADRLTVFPVALRDDSTTEDVDESRWQEHAWDEQRVALVRDAAGFWFTGGDQMRIVSLLRSESGQLSPLLSLIHQRLQAGAVVGGTSAGAAIMSERMITGGDSFTALIEPGPVDYEAIEEQESGHLSMTAGLGFLSQGLVDQHFDRKARLGRLVRALDLADAAWGYGVDEDTAMVVELASGRALVVGSGSITVLDAGNARYHWPGPQLARTLQLSLYPAGSTFDLATGKPLTIVGDPTVGEEYFGHSLRAGGGMAFPNQTLEQMLGNDLLDNRAAQELRRWSIDARGQALVYVFRQTAQSAGYWGRVAGASRYTITAVDFSIDRIQVTAPTD
ncbi:cyanophycinase [Halioglobus sp. HI00S01]|uniref:cyanophycinase n=1 Tax=Halioglobus sp. HI00S01 TaxID=1822214 RepID=UPI000ADD59A1|nr:cyanophycinase [Halioglobus sp. HI00S01]